MTVKIEIHVMDNNTYPETPLISFCNVNESLEKIITDFTKSSASFISSNKDQLINEKGKVTIFFKNLKLTVMVDKLKTNHDQYYSSITFEECLEKIFIELFNDLILRYRRSIPIQIHNQKENIISE